MTAALSVTALTVHSGQRQLVQALSFQVQRGELLGVIGPNGAGKSTVIKAIAQVQRYHGQITLNGQILATLPPLERARRVAYLSQEDALQWALTVEDFVSLGRYPHRRWWSDERQRATDHAAIARALHVTDTWALRQRPVTTLSGGERARVRLARVLAVEAALVLADEPLAALDPRHQLQLMALLQTHCRAGISIILVLHDLTLASRFCDRLLLLQHGQLIASGAPTAVLTAANLRTVYGIAAVAGEYQNQAYLLPWAAVDAADT
ncbi:ABC transporter [Chromatium okenii]|uniref:ABC transporter ATP-binding protein n=1 Tax=Chromatium okenii TaxID=61644 RepID=UPI0019057C32|nr:ABC transporter ATP-binding protein [Chromatium okenii]MBK1642788.1 ABC transporter [Chromatium okenii]